jgi:HSP20 family protein
MANRQYLTSPSRAISFPTDFDEIFDRMMRSRWPFDIGLPARSSNEPRALRAFEHMPKVEVKENDKAYTVTVELPGLEEKDVKVHVESDMLTISGEKKVEQSDDKTHYSERSYGSFARSFTLPADADSNAVTARFAKGVLSVEVAKTTNPSPKVKQVEVKPA